MSIHPYKHMHTHVYLIPRSTSEILSWLDLKIYEVGHQERLIVDGEVVFH
jgi:hypothetical protein